MLRKEMKMATLGFVALMTLIVVVLATSPFWHMKIRWTYADTSFGVYTDITCITPWDHTLNLTGVSDPQTFNFTIKNKGNVAIDVTITNQTIVNGTATWSPTSLINLAVGSSDTMRLTLTFIGNGSYDFDFKSSKHL